MKRILNIACLAVLLWRSFNPFESWRDRNQSYSSNLGSDWNRLYIDHDTVTVALGDGSYANLKSINPCKGMETPRRYDNPETGSVKCWDSKRQAFVAFDLREQ
jgi:hypothetical protein